MAKVKILKLCFLNLLIKYKTTITRSYLSVFFILFNSKMDVLKTIEVLFCFILNRMDQQLL